MFQKLIKQWHRFRMSYEDRADEPYVMSAKRRIAFVSEIFPKRGVGVELGVFKGHFSQILLEYTSPEQLHLIDPWFFYSSHWSWAKGNQSTVDASVRVIQAFKDDIEARRVYVHIGFDTEVLSTFPNNYFDWAYIDSTHAYDQTKTELDVLSRKIKHKGLIAGDDWRPDPSHRHHGVFRAVTDFVASREFEIIYSDSEIAQWAIKRA